MYKLTPQYIVSYDQVNTCFLHGKETEKKRNRKVGIGVGLGEWRLLSEVFGGAFLRNFALTYAVFFDSEFVRFDLTIFGP